MHARKSDPALAVLVQELKERGLLEDMRVIVGTEFGRTSAIHLGGFPSIHNGRDDERLTYRQSGRDFGVTHVRQM